MSDFPSFNVQHAPIGAFAALTLGHAHTRGGLAIERGRPGEQNVFVGWQDADAALHLLPFFVPHDDARAAFEVDANLRPPPAPSEAHGVERELGPSLDRFRWGPLTLEIVSPRAPLVDPDEASPEACRLALCPAVLVRLAFDNTHGGTPRRCFFALQDDIPFRDLEQDGAQDLRGVALQHLQGLATRPRAEVRTICAFGIDEALASPTFMRLGKVAGLCLEVAPGSSAEVVFAVGVHRSGVVTTGMAGRYLYTRWFEGLEDVLAHALDHAETYFRIAARESEELLARIPDPARRFFYAQAVQSYYGSTIALDIDRRATWVVVEGEYLMLNTLDLAVDQAFFELARHPWTLRNLLDGFADRYAYEDSVRCPATGAWRTGGIGFCHDQGVAMQWSPPSHSAYEQANIPGRCFSYMTYEELTNYVLCFALYVHHTRDLAFARRRHELLTRCFDSLRARDLADPAARTGIMQGESSRTGTGAEISTYDSLDASLGPAFGNTYLAVKAWACHLALAVTAQHLGDDALATAAHDMAEHAARTLLTAFSAEDGRFPANLSRDLPSVVLAIVEPLVHPHALGLHPWPAASIHARLCARLREHLVTALRSGACHFPDGGWRLSSTSANTWLSKLVLVDHVARGVLCLSDDELGPDPFPTYARWLRASGYWAASDQFVDGVAMGSRYYPRLVTAALWLWPPG